MGELNLKNKKKFHTGFNNNVFPESGKVPNYI